MLDLDVIWRNLPFLMIQGFLGFGNFVGGTLRLAIPSIVLGFVLGIFIGIGRLAPQWWIRMPATVYVEFFRGVPAGHGDLLDVVHHARSCSRPPFPSSASPSPPS